MYKIDEAYGKKFFDKRKSLNWRAPIVGDVIMEVFVPSSVVDVGCGNADILGYLHTKCNVKNTLAIEGTVNSIEAIVANYVGPAFIHDLRVPLHKFTKYSLCLCLEVAEHIEQDYAHILVQNLVQLSDTILFSAAGPVQGGSHHVNCQSEEYWWYKFNNHGYGKNIWTTEQFREKLQPYAHKKGIKAYVQNSIVYKRIGT